MRPEESALLEDLNTHRRTVDTDYFDLSLRELARMVEQEEIRIAPEFQRQFRWNSETQSALIESFLLGLPIPAIFVATNIDGTWELVDGLQRICTVLRFFGVDAPESPKLKFSQDILELEELRTLKNFEGLRYQDLPRPIRLTLERRYLRVQVLSDKSDVEVRFELFRRLNAGAIALTPQEIRACIFQGSFNVLLSDLAEYQPYRMLLKLQKKDTSNGTAEEVVLKFFAYLDEGQRFDGNVIEFLNSYMKDHQNETDITPYRELFTKVADYLASINPGPILRRRTNWTPVNQIEALMVGVGRIFARGGEPVTPQGDWLNDEELERYSKQGTNTRTNFHGRIDRAEKLFSGQ